MKLTAIAVILLITAGCLKQPKSENSSTRQVSSAGHAIVRAEILGDAGILSHTAEWEVGEADVVALEHSIDTLFAKPDKRMTGLMDDNPTCAPFPLSDYYMRYAGVVKNGKRLIIGKAFHRSTTDSEKVLRSRDAGIIVFGGGAGYFTVVYDADDRRLVELTYNCPL